MSARPDTAPAPNWTPTADQAATIERKAYCQGWWWGFSSGLICGSCSVGLLAFLLWTLAKALGFTC